MKFSWIQWYRSEDFFWFRINIGGRGYGIHMKRIGAGYELFSLRDRPHWDYCGWRFRWLTA